MLQEAREHAYSILGLVLVVLVITASVGAVAYRGWYIDMNGVAVSETARANYFETQYQAARVEVEDLQVQLASKIDQLTRTQTDLAAAKDEIQGLTSRLTAIAGENQVLLDALTTLRASGQANQVKLAEATAEITRLHAAAADLRAAANASPPSQAVALHRIADNQASAAQAAQSTLDAILRERDRADRYKELAADKEQLAVTHRRGVTRLASDYAMHRGQTLAALVCPRSDLLRPSQRADCFADVTKKVSALAPDLEKCALTSPEDLEFRIGFGTATSYGGAKFLFNTTRGAVYAELCEAAAGGIDESLRGRWRSN